MDPSTTLKNEIFRPLTMIVIPGAFSVAPFIAVLSFHFPRFGQFARAETNLFLLTLLFVITAAGFVLEDLGSRIEDYWDAKLNNKYPGRAEFWHEYLRLKIQDEYIGQRYLRTIYIRFKFELSMAPGLFCFLIGLIWVNNLTHTWGLLPMCGLSVFILAVIAYLLLESYQSAYVLGTLHKSISQAASKCGSTP